LLQFYLSIACQTPHHTCPCPVQDSRTSLFGEDAIDPLETRNNITCKFLFKIVSTFKMAFEDVGSKN
jgi:hypothetical protein